MVVDRRVGKKSMLLTIEIPIDVDVMEMLVDLFVLCPPFPTSHDGRP